MVNANTFIQRSLAQVNEPIFVLKSQRGYHMVTVGSFNSKEDAFSTLNHLPKNIKDERPFLSILKYDLESNDSRILSRLNNTVMEKNIIKSKEIMVQKIAPQKEITLTKKPKTKQTNKVIKHTTIQKMSNHTYIDSISVAYGQNKSHKNLYRIGLQKNFQETYFDSKVGYISGYYDIALSHHSFDKAIYSLSLSPVFTYNFKTNHSITPYLFGGIGATFLSDTSTENKQFSTTFQFEDRIGIGAKNASHAVELGYFHSSNASIKKPNDGMDMVYLTYLHNF